jgi:DNA-binding NarL/FixJ family response regulator
VLEATGGTVVVLVSRGSEEPHTPPEERAVSSERERRERGPRRYLHEAMAASDKTTLRHAPAAGDARTVAACVAISADPGAWFSSASSPLAKRLGSLIRLDDRICMVGGGRIVVLFQGVDPNLHAHVLGARLARSTLEGLSGSGARSPQVTVGMAEGDHGVELLHLTSAAINSSKRWGSVARSAQGHVATDSALVVLTTISSAEQSSTKLARRTVTWVSPVATQALQLNMRGAAASASVSPGAVFVVDTAPPFRGVPGPACEAVTSLVEGFGLTVAGTLAPSNIESDLSGMADSGVAEGMALLVVHPGNEVETQEEHTEALERPAAITHALRQLGMRVLAVGVGASDIALAECMLQGAESAFAIRDLPEELTYALTHAGSDGIRTESNGTQPEHNGQRMDRLAKLLLLTRSERRVLYHLTTGATAIEIAEKLVLSLATVRSHIRSILRKLEVSSQLAAVAIAQGHPVRPSENDHDRAKRLSQQGAASAPQR